MQTKKSRLFPNLYAFLVGPPGIGKSETIKAIKPYLENRVHIAPTSVTGASIVDAMAAAKINFVDAAVGGNHLEYYSMLLMPDELSAFMSEYASDLVAMMTTFHDVGHYSQLRRATGNHIKLNAPQLSMLAGTTTSHLMKTLPDGAWDQGFMSRTIIIYSGKAIRKGDMFDNAEDQWDEDLEFDMDQIANCQGQLSIGDSYRTAYAEWRNKDCKPEPTHPRLRSYNSRREAHLLKLSMVACVDLGDHLHLERVHFDRAYSWLTGAEAFMPYTFIDVSTPESRALEEAVYQINGKQMSEGQLTRFLSSRNIPFSQIKYSIDVMVSSGMIQDMGKDPSGLRIFRVPRHDGDSIGKSPHPEST